MTDKTRDYYKTLLQIDQNLDRLVREIDVLNYLNPLNIEQEKKRFFASKFSEDPVFKYRKLKFDPYTLQRQFFSQRLEDIPDEDIYKLYHDTIYEYSGLVQCVATVGKDKKFFYNSLRVFGTPTEKDVKNAKFILHFHKEEDAEEMVPRYNADQAQAYFQAFGEQYPFRFKVRQSNSITGAAMALNSRELVVKKNRKFSDNDLKILSNHEIGVNMLTTFNGLDQPLRIFSNGFANNYSTQVGLGIFSEYMSDSLSLKRVKELAYRVLAADSLIKGYSFSDTFDLLFSQYKLDRETSWLITLRAHRGGGFTKDHQYLPGLKKIYDYFSSGKDMGILLTGKVALEDVELIKSLQQKGLAKENTYFTHAFNENRNTNDKLEFLLSNLK
ncbi:flavohemoglobin expression-modulating QEGLA motif protein [Salinimicrobium sp. HB62]|uniref:flavohemoglobin expression-modulating QEGLA motif protein n=1 Tax=Salinimicrobium sp. HB62 TaxID=3077781 RepID=UPI002D7A0119|nr:tyrosine/phenylalanine carboxypeptidase domain-containing protein [Salinimicrobium sp. HB62]